MLASTCILVTKYVVFLYFLGSFKVYVAVFEKTVQRVFLARVNTHVCTSRLPRKDNKLIPR